MCEMWAKIGGFNGEYEISSYGRVRSYKIEHNRYHTGVQKRPHLLKTRKDKRGYIHIFLNKNGKCVNYLIHRLVAQAFLPNPNNYPQVNHKDENKSNNKVENLEWCTKKYNLHYSNVCQKMVTAAKIKRQKVVLMYDEENRFLREFESATIAAKYIGDYQQNVSACCYGKIKKVKGFIFKFK